MNLLLFLAMTIASDKPLDESSAAPCGDGALSVVLDEPPPPDPTPTPDAPPEPDELGKWKLCWKGEPKEECDDNSCHGRCGCAFKECSQCCVENYPTAPGCRHQCTLGIAACNSACE